jgi:hypothetical protein
MGFRAERQALDFHGDSSHFFGFLRNFFQDSGIIETGQHTTGWSPSVRLAGFPERGKKGGGTTWSASLFIFVPRGTIPARRRIQS